MTAAAAPGWHDPGALRCWGKGCGHVLEAHDPAGACVVMYCTCRAWIEPAVPGAGP